MKKRVFSMFLSLMIVLMSVSGAQAALVLPSSVTAIESEAFYGDVSISGNVTLPSGVKNVGERAFAGTDIYSLWLPASVRSIGAGVLDGTDAVYAVVPSSTATLASGALGVPYLIGVSGWSAEKWAAQSGVAFLNIYNIVWHDGFCYQMDDGNAVLLFARSEGVSGSVTIPEYVDGWPVTQVDSYAFTRLDGVTEISLPEAASVAETRVNWPDASISTYSNAGESQAPEGATEVALEYAQMTMNPGEEYWISVTEELPEGEAEWTYASSDEGVATVEDGNIVALKLGETIVSVTISHENGEVYYGSVRVSVVEPKVEIYLYDETMSVPVGSEFWPDCWDYSDSSTVSDADFAWSSDDEGVVTMGEYGDLIAVAPGTATCTFTLSSNGAEASASITITVYEPDVALNYYRLYTYTELQYQLEVTDELPEGASVSFTTNNEEVATVDENGLVSPLAEGTAVITCTVTYADGTSALADCTVDVSPMRMSWYSTEPIEVLVGQTEQVWPGTSIRIWSRHYDYAIASVSVEDESIISYEKNERPLFEEQIATAHKLGTTNVTFTTRIAPPEALEGKTITQTLPVTVVEPWLEAYIDQEKIEIYSIGEREHINAWYNCEVGVDSQYFTSSDASVATVDSHGYVTATGAGEATITYHVVTRGCERTAEVKVTVHGFDVTLNKTEATIARGESFMLVPSYACESENIEVWFESNESRVVAVDESGNVTGVAAGTATVVCGVRVDGEESVARCLVTVTDDAAAITLNATYIELNEGQSFQLVPTFSGTAENVTYQSENPGAVSVDESGLVTINGDWNSANYLPRVFCRATVDGVEAEASCAVRRVTPDAVISGFYPSGALRMNVGDEDWIGCNVTIANAEVQYSIAYESADEKVVTVDASGHIVAVGAGHTTVTVSLLAADGSVYDTEEFYAYVETDYPIPESIAFEYDQYVLNTDEVGPQPARDVNAFVYPDDMWRYYGVEIESLTPDVVEIIDGNCIHALQTGEGKIQATVRYEEDGEEKTLTATAQVFVADMRIVADKEVYQPGDIATLTIENFPTGLNAWDYINWEFQDDSNACSYYYQQGTTLKVTVNQPGEYTFRADLRIGDQWHNSYEYTLVAEGDQVNEKLALSNVSVGVGEEWWNGPDFDAGEITTHSSDESVVIAYLEDDPCAFRAVGEGEADVTYTYYVDGEKKTLTMHVRVVPFNDWYMTGMDSIPSVMRVGTNYWCDADFASNLYRNLNDFVEYTISDPEIARVDPNDHRCIIPLKAGTFTLTATVDYCDKTETMSKEIIVIEPAVRPEHNEIELRPGASYAMNLVAGEGYEVESVTWTSGNTGRATVDASGTATVCGTREYVTIYAHVVFTDGTSADTSYRIRIVPDEDVYMDVYNASWSGVDLATEDWGALGTTGTLWLAYNTNADESEISCEWTIADENVAVLEPIEGEGPGVIGVKAVGEGSTQVLCTMQVGENGCFFSQEWMFNVNVLTPDTPADAVQVAMNFEAITMNPDEEAFLGIEEELPEHEGWEDWQWRSTNHDVVEVDGEGRIYTHNLGAANIIVTVTCESGEVFYGIVPVTVVEPNVEITVYESVVNVPVGDKFYPNWDYTDTSDITDPNIWYEISDENVVTRSEVEYELSALEPGQATVAVCAETHGEAVRDTIIVNVYEPPFTLNYYHLYAYEGLQYQLEVTSELPEDVTVSYETSNADVISVDENGLVTALAEGTECIECVVTYADGTQDRVDCLFEVGAWQLEWASEEAMEIRLGSTEQVWPGVWITWYYERHKEAADVRIQVEDESILTYEQTELKLYDEKIATAHKLGTTNVTYTVSFNPPEAVEGKTITQTLSVTVVEPWMEAEIEQDSIELSTVGDHEYLRFGYNAEVSIESQYFTSSDEGVATVDAYGRVTAVGTGEATITYHIVALGVEKTDTVQVIVDGYDVTLSKTEMTLKKGESFYLLAEVDAPDGANVNVHFDSSQWNVAFVDGESGLVTALAQGAAVIFVDGDVDGRHIRSQCVVHVEDDELPISLHSDMIYVRQGDTFTLEPTFDGEATDIVFGTEDETCLPIDENGVVTVMYEWDNVDYAPHVWCNATINGERVTARMLVRYGTARAAIRVNSHVRMNAQEAYYLHYDVFTEDADLAYALSVTSSDENVVTYDAQSGELIGVNNGAAVVTITVSGEDGTVYARETVNIFVGVEPDEPESIAFGRSYYMVNPEGSTTANGDERSCETDVWANLLPDEANMYYGDIRYTVEDSEIAFVEEGGGRLVGLQQGETTVTATVTYWYGDEEKQLTTSAPVYVVAPEVTTDKESYGQLELATLTLANLPENVEYEIEWNYEDGSHANRRVSQDGASLTVRTYQPGEWRFEAVVRYENYEEAFETTLVVEGEETDRYLSDQDVTAAVGEVMGVWPMFDCGRVTTESSDTSVVSIDPDDPCQLTMAGAGEATVTYTCEIPNSDEVVTLACNFVVNEAEWALLDLWNLPAAMRVGQTYWCEPNYEANTWNNLENYITLSVDDETIAQTDDSLNVTVLREGTFTLTATIDFGGRTESVSREIHAVELAIYAESDYVEWRPNTTHEMNVIVNDGREIASVQWTSGDESQIAVNEDGTFTVQDITGGGNQIRMNAVVTFTDGSTETATFRVYIVPDWNVYMGVHDMTWNTSLSSESWGSEPHQATLYAHYDTNAAAEEISIEWRSSDESVFTIGERYDEWGYTSVVATAVGEGEAYAECIVKVGENGELYDRSFNLNVHVTAPVVTVTPEAESIAMTVGESRYLNWNVLTQNAGPTSTQTIVSSDESVVLCDVHGNIQAVGVGTATVTYTEYIRGESAASGVTTITVTGVDVDILEESIELSAGETAVFSLDITTPDDETDYGVSWESANPDVVVVDNQGMIYAVGRGVTYVTVHVDFDGGNASDSCKIIVDGSAQALMIDFEEIEVYGEQEKQLSYVLSDEAEALGGAENITWSSSDENIVAVNENGLVSVNDVPWTQYATIICTAEIDGESYTAYCSVTAHPRRIRLQNWNMGEGSWRGMSIGETEEIGECYVATGGVSATAKYESSDTNVVVVNQSGVVEAVGQGEALVTLTVTGSNGEVCTATRFYRVEMEEITPTSLTANCETYVTHVNWGDRYVPVTVGPDYASWQFEFSGYDESVLYIREDGWMEPRNAGRTTVQVGIVGTDLTASFDVLMLDDSIVLKEENGETAFKPGDEIKLVFEGNVLWNDADVEEITYDYDWNCVRKTGDAEFIAMENHTENTEIWAHVRFENGEQRDYCYSLSIDAENSEYFMALIDGEPDPIVWAGFERGMDLRSNVEYTDAQFVSSNTDVVTVDEETGAVKAVGVGTATITVTAKAGEETLTATIHLTVREPETPIVRCVPETVLIPAGDTVNVYIAHENAFSFPPDHEYTSDNEDVLRSNGYDEDAGAFTIRAMSAGSATLTVTAHYGDMEAQDSVTIYVIAGAQ